MGARKRAGKGGVGSSGLVAAQQPGAAASAAGPTVDAGWHCFDKITQGGAGLTVIAALALLLHLNTLEGGFVYDDARGVVANSDVPGDQPLSNLFINDFWGKPMARYQSHKSYRPVTVLTFRLDHYIAGAMTPFQFHVTNVVLHTVVCGLYYLVCTKIFDAASPAFAAALLFTVHSIHSEAVANIVGRAEVLAGVFYLAALLLYSRAASRTDPDRTGWLSLLLSLGCAAAAMLSKEQGITVLGVLAVYDVGLVCRVGPLEALSGMLRGEVTGLRARLVAIAATGAGLLAFRVWMMGEGQPIFNEYELPALSHPDLTTRVLTFSWYAVINAGLLLFPLNQSSDWSYGSIPLVQTVADPRFVLIALFYVVVVFAVAKSIFWSPGPKMQNLSFAPVLGFGWLFLAYLPSSNLLFKVGFVIAERILFLPSMGYCILVAAILGKGYNKQPKVVTLAFMALCTFLASRTLLRNQDWQSDFTLHEAGARAQPYNIKLITNYGMLLQDKAKDTATYPDEATRKHFFEQAEATYERALTEVIGEMHFPNLYFVYGNLMIEKGEQERGVELYKKGLQKMDKTGTTLNLLNNLASQLFKMKKYDESEQYFRACVQIDANHATALNGLAALYATVGKHEEADKAFTDITQRMPRYTEGWFNYGTYLAGIKRWDEAEATFLKALELSPGHAGAATNLKYVHFHQKKEKK